METFIRITREQYASLLRESRKLRALENAGVDNWEWYDEAISSLEEEEEERTMSTDPIFAEDGSWFYWDETWTNKFGPFRSESLARASLKLYVEFELEGTARPTWS